MIKETYFTAADLPGQAAALLGETYACCRPRGAEWHGGAAALLLLDLQHFFADPGSHAHVPALPAILPGLFRLARAFVAAGRPVWFTRHGHRAEDRGPLTRWWRDPLRTTDPMAGLVWPEAAALGRIVDKSSYDAFLHTDLQAQLQERGIGQVVIGGVMTHLCCESTARTAFQLGFDVFFLVDGCATYRRDLHLGSLRALAHGFARPLLVAEALAHIGAGEGSRP